MDRWLKRLVWLSGATFLLALTGLVGVGIYQGLHVPAAVGQELVKRADSLDKRLEHIETKANAITEDYLETTRLLRIETHAARLALQDVPGMLDERLRLIQDDARAQIASAIEKADVQLTETNASIRKLVESTQPTLDAWASVSRQIDTVAKENLTCVDNVTGKHNPRCWPSRITGIMGDLHTGLGEWALTMRTFRKDEKEFLDVGKGIGNNVEKTTANLERLTRPESLWMKGFKIAAPIVGGFVWSHVVKK